MKTRFFILFFVLTGLTQVSKAQNVYTIKADTTRLTGCDSNELIIENHSQNVSGFLFNTGKGRTIFKKGAQKLNDSMYLIGADTMKFANAWLQGGNHFGDTGILGTLDNYPLDFYTNDSARMRLTNKGNLLLGTSTDNGYKLRVNGTGNFFSLYTNADTGSGWAPHINMASGGSYNALIGTMGHDMYFQTTNTQTDFRFLFGSPTSTRDLNIIGPGVGTTPSGNITISSSNTFLDIFSLLHITNDDSPLYLTTNGPPAAGGVVVSRGTRTNSITDPIFTVVEGDTTVFDALKNGKVGIGTSTPSAQFHTTGTVRFAGLTADSTQTRVLVSDASGNLFYRSASSLAAEDILRSSLAVNGPIKAKSLTLSPSDWPDYVFDSSYRLPSLKEVDNYVRHQHHLPGIPSATEASDKGIDVGANQAALLKKIEELTLYSVQQEKEIDTLKKEMEQLKQLLLEKLKK